MNTRLFLPAETHRFIPSTLKKVKLLWALRLLRVIHPTVAPRETEIAKMIGLLSLMDQDMQTVRKRKEVRGGTRRSASNRRSA